jgi:integrase
LGALLIAERAALLAGRDDEFVACVLKTYTGMRWGEMVGLETEFVRPESVRIEWQLYQLDTGELLRCPPKDDSYRTADLPSFLSNLLSDHIGQTTPQPCHCHGRTYVFRGLGAANGATRRPGATLVDVARRAGVSPATVSAFINRPNTVAAPTRTRIEAAIADLVYVRGGTSGESAPHWRRNGFATWLFQPAVSGWYPRKGRYEARPVPVRAEPQPAVPVRGRNASGRADTCWVPIAPGLTPHGLRHTHKTRMRGLRTPPKLMDERLGHDDGSVQGRYDHITPEMRWQLMVGLTAEWEAALDARLSMCPTSPVAVLNSLLRARETMTTGMKDGQMSSDRRVVW